jgi:arylsulfatase A-like enzyme
VVTRLLERRWPWLVAAVVIVLIFLSTFVRLRLPASWDLRPRGSAEDIAQLRNRRDVNMLFILVDTLRADRLGCYGYPRPTSPYLDKLAAGGVRFARQLAQSSWTKCSMASLWTSLYPARTGLTRFDQVVPDEAQLPAEVFAQAGFRTVGIYRNGWVAPTFGFGQGFHVYRRPQAIPLPASVKLANPTLNEEGSDEGTIAAALEFLRIDGHKRWFLYLHLMDVHQYLYDEDSALFGTDHPGIYANSVRRVDHVIQAMIDSLSDQGLRANTLIAIASDHGEAFGERGFEGHAREVFRETTEVPFLISFPFRLDPGLTVAARTRNVDIWPTLFDLLGLPTPEDADGRSLVPEIVALARGEAPPGEERTAIAHLDQNWGTPGAESSTTVAVAENEHRYVRLERPEGHAEDLFDRRDDPDEVVDRSGDQPETLEHLRKIADDYLASQPVFGAPPARDVDQLELNQLRALGYAIP